MGEIGNTGRKLGNWEVFRAEQGETLRILLLEDLLSDAELIKLQLRRLQFAKEIEHVTNREDFEAALQRFNPHLILSDYALPQFTGMEALEFVREQNTYIPFIICTGSVNEETAVACIKAGADDYVLKDSMGRLVSAVENALEAKRNLVEKERVVNELEASEADFRALAENAPDNIYKLDHQGTIQYVSRDVDGQPRNEVIGKSIYDFAHVDYRDTLRQAVHSAFANQERISLEVEGTPISGERQFYLVRIGPVLADQKVDSVVFIPGNITKRVRAEDETKRLNKRLQKLTHHLETVRDEEKKKIAMEIHDQLGQELTGSKLGLFWLKQHLEEHQEGGVDFNQVFDKIDYLVDLTTTTIQTVRRIAHELRPVVLDNMGLVAALDWHVKNYNENNPVHCKFKSKVDDSGFSHEFNTAMYRIVQEALTNIHKHARASEAAVELVEDRGTILLEISDNGIGVDEEKALKSNSLGLFGIRERIKRWNGEFALRGSENDGTTIRIAVKRDEIE